MPSASDRKSLLVIFSVFFFVVTVTYFISLFARGYRINLTQTPPIKSTGLLSATSRPKSASVYINDRLVTATDDTINLPPGQYSVKIIKDGYLPWSKLISIKKELVFQTDTQLYRSVTDLKPITISGAINPSLSPDGSKVIYAVASASATRDNGLYQIDLYNNLLPISRNSPRQIAPNSSGIDWSKFTFTFSPNSRAILASNRHLNYLINLDSPINSSQLFDATPRLPIIKAEWLQQSVNLIQSKLERLPSELRSLVSTESALLMSHTDDKVLYQAKADGHLPPHLLTPAPAQSTQTQTRQIKTGNYYVYDLRDDTNFLIGPNSALLNPLWLPNSNSLIFVENNQVKVIDYDATNKLTLFRGDFDPSLVFPWSDGSRIITLLSVYPGAPNNLYAITIR
jgi:hypothetical protein